MLRNISSTKESNSDSNSSTTSSNSVSNSQSPSQTIGNNTTTSVGSNPLVPTSIAVTSTTIASTNSTHDTVADPVYGKLRILNGQSTWTRSQW